MTINEAQDEIIGEFSVFDEWLDKYEYLIELSGSLPAIGEEHKNEQFLIRGCQSRVWVDAELRDGKIYFTADSDVADPRAQRPHAAGDRRLGPLFHRPDRAQGEPLSHPGQRIARDDQADETVRAGVPKQTVDDPP